VFIRKIRGSNMQRLVVRAARAPLFSLRIRLSGNLGTPAALLDRWFFSFLKKLWNPALVRVILHHDS
jgi:hypothetical protein